MTSNDFAEWARYHGEAFPSLADWLEKHPETVKFWVKAMDAVDVRDAKTATDEMASGRLDEPKGFGQHPKVIAARARQIGASRAASLRVVDGERVYDCPLCLDEGFVPVVDPVPDHLNRAVQPSDQFLDHRLPFRVRHDRTRQLRAHPAVQTARWLATMSTL